MRPIDADYITEGRVSNDPVVIAAKSAPTIDAIPVEWLREFDLYYAGITGGTKYMNELVEAWQKGQEAMA